MKSKIREYFVENIHPATEHKNLVVAEERLIRYHQCLDHYLSVNLEECCNGCAEDLLKEIEKNAAKTRTYIRYGGSQFKTSI